MTTITRYGLVSALLVAICLGWYASSLSDDLSAARKDNKTLVDTVNDRDGTITALKESIAADRRATEEQLKLEQQKRAKADAENRTLRKALEHSDASNQPLPADAIRVLRGETQNRTAP
ncbi:DUF2570 family protein [Serratia fonticola]|uniref:DUF2570 family protein n=1 Tax=Serratia fonticola TaxID=47917 RepID=UPI0015C65480|nr:DUF2570 family protein [Serratia fonticola]NYA15744.1 DUF2570 family protein [Serratia fonticola]NYA35864.1 DUF2570 family protein [Serratia fonticola]